MGDLPAVLLVPPLAWPSRTQAEILPVVPPVGVAVGTGLFIVHDYAVRGARGAGRWLLIVACELEDARTVSFLVC